MRRASLTNECGMALPMAMLVLLLLTPLMIAFAMLAQTEPVIAANQMRIAQARALAETGFEQAVWSLTYGNNDSGDPNGIPNPMVLANPGLASSTAVAPWNGATFVQMRNGGYVVAIRNDQSPGADPNIREITATGWTPTNDPAVPGTKAHRTVFARVKVIPPVSKFAPCALCVKGGLSVSGTVSIDGTNTDPSCGGNTKYGTYTKETTVTVGTPSITGGAGGSAQNQAEANFKGFTYDNDALNTLKALAKQNGTYYGPGYPNGGFTNNGSTLWSGAVAFNSSNLLYNGVVFIDTTDGQNLDPSGTDTARMANVTMNGNPALGIKNPLSTAPNVPAVSTPSWAFSGAIVVNGSLSISGDMRINGLVYTVNDFTYAGIGPGGIYGQVISQNYRDILATNIDSTSGGNARIEFNCANAKGFGMIPPSFKFIEGSYREISG